MIYRIYYSDDEIIDGYDPIFDPFLIERRADVQVIVQPSPAHNWVTLSGNDYYVWDDRGSGYRWYGVDIFGFHHYMLQPGEKCVLFGIKIDTYRFNEIFNQAREEMGNKEAFAIGERQP